MLKFSSYSSEMCVASLLYCSLRYRTKAVQPRVLQYMLYLYCALDTFPPLSIIECYLWQCIIFYFKDELINKYFYYFQVFCTINKRSTLTFILFLEYFTLGRDTKKLLWSVIYIL